MWIDLLLCTALHRPTSFGNVDLQDHGINIAKWYRELTNFQETNWASYRSMVWPWMDKLLLLAWSASQEQSFFRPHNLCHNVCCRLAFGCKIWQKALHQQPCINMQGAFSASVITIWHVQRAMPRLDVCMEAEPSSLPSVPAPPSTCSLGWLRS